MSESEVEKIRNYIGGFDNLSPNMQDWTITVAKRLKWNRKDLATYQAIVSSPKDMAFFSNLKLKANKSYYVVSNQWEFLEKFRVYYKVFGIKNTNDYIEFTNKVFLSTYEKALDDEDFNIDRMVVSNKRLLVYCHKNNNYVSDKQKAWIQGNLFASDICDRLINGSKVLILAEYEVNEIETLVGRMPLTKIKIGDSDLKHHGLYAENYKPEKKSKDRINGERDG